MQPPLFLCLKGLTDLIELIPMPHVVKGSNRSWSYTTQRVTLTLQFPNGTGCNEELLGTMIPTNTTITLGLTLAFKVSAYATRGPSQFAPAAPTLKLLTNMIIPQLQLGKHGAEVAGMFFVVDNTFLLVNGMEIAEDLQELHEQTGLLPMG